MFSDQCVFIKGTNTCTFYFFLSNGFINQHLHYSHLLCLLLLLVHELLDILLPILCHSSSSRPVWRQRCPRPSHGSAVVPQEQQRSAAGTARHHKPHFHLIELFIFALSVRSVSISSPLIYSSNYFVSESCGLLCQKTVEIRKDVKYQSFSIYFNILRCVKRKS